MSISVRFMSFLSGITGKSEYLVQVPCQTVEDVLAHLFTRFPDLKDHLLDESGEMEYIYNIFLNGNIVPWPKRERVYVSPGDSIILLAVVGGG